MGPDTLPREAATPAASAGRRRFPIGAEALPEGGVDFRVWAPRCRELTVEIENLRPIPLSAEAGGYFSTQVDEARPGMRYRFRPDNSDQAYPDPASHFQPEGPHGPSEIIDPGAFRWSDTGWRGRRRDELVIYEMHIGTFAPEGTWQAAQRELPALAELGITCLELMPVADFPGNFGWGYDGVDLFAPTRLYGRPDDFRAFVDRAHALGLAVILDVVYNHLGPDGNYLKCFSESYFTDRYKNEWGEAVNFDGPDSGPVREFVLANVRYWIEEFHLDGLRLDATQQMFDASPEHILAAITREVRNAGPGRWRAMTAHLLLMPGIPMLFQGQEFAASNPFLYFADHRPGLDRAVRRGRREFLGQFPSMAAPEIGERLADPSDAESFRRSTLDPAERQTHAGAAAMHRDLLALRRDDPALGLHTRRIDGAVLGARAWLLRFFSDEGDRLLIVNLGPDLTMRPAPEPLLAPIEGHDWDILWSGEITRRYHGFLIAALPAPQGRIVMLNDLDVAVGRPDGSIASLRDSGRFVDFTLTMGLPSWRYEIDGVTIEKSVLMPARHNITYIGFRLIGGARTIRLLLRPAVNFRRIEAAVSEPLPSGYALTADGERYEIAAA